MLLEPAFMLRHQRHTKCTLCKQCRCSVDLQGRGEHKAAPEPASRLRRRVLTLALGMPGTREVRAAASRPRRALQS